MSLCAFLTLLPATAVLKCNNTSYLRHSFRLFASRHVGRCLYAALCSLCVLDCPGGTLDMVSLGEIAFWSLEGGDTLSCPEGNDPLGTLSCLCSSRCHLKHCMFRSVISPAPSSFTGPALVSHHHMSARVAARHFKRLWSLEPVKPLNTAGVIHGDTRWHDLQPQTDGDRIFFFLPPSPCTVLISHVQP